MRSIWAALSFFLATEAIGQTSEPTSNPGNTWNTGNPEPLLQGTPPSNPAGRPDGLTLGLGVGAQAPQGAFGLNVVSARLRLTTGLTLEPIVVGTFNQNVDTVTINGVAVTTDTDTTSLTLALGVRYPLASRGPVDFLVLGVPAVNLTKTEVDPDGNNNNTITKSRSAALNWGIGLEWFVRPKLSFSFNALNPLVVFNVTETEDEAAVVINTDKDLLVGAIFAPVVQVLLHLYF